MDKRSLRKSVREKIAALDESYIISSDREITDSLLSLPEVQKADRIFAYLSVGREVDTRRFLRSCLSAGRQIALPVIIGQCIEFAAVGSLDELIPGAYGIPAPPPDALRLYPHAHDAVIVPALCFDEKLHRLGQGGGYYDRFLSGCPAVTIGICREKLICSGLPSEPHDIPVSLLVTEERKRGR